MKRSLAFGSLLFVAAFSGCGGSSPAQAPKAAGPGQPGPAPVAVAQEGKVARADEAAAGPPAWEPRGRRDPFAIPAAREGAAGMTVASAKLTGIVRGAGNALALVETSDGLGYILKTGDTLADGRLVEIGPNSVVFTVVPRPGSNSNRVVLRLAGD